ncbi:MAG: hypothetical protein AAFW73_22980 [Bacteroidota bacterium]
MDRVDHICQQLRTYCAQNQIEITDENFQAVCKQALSQEDYEHCFLPDALSDQLDEWALRGEAWFDQEKYRAAIECYERGMALVPEPRNRLEATLWFLAAIADAYWCLREYPQALRYLEQSLEVVGGKTERFVQLRRGQVLFELGRGEEAGQVLRGALALGGAELFEGEHPKYLALAKSIRP